MTKSIYLKMLGNQNISFFQEEFYGIKYQNLSEDHAGTNWFRSAIFIELIRLESISKVIF